MQHTHPITTYEELHNLISDNKSALDTINVNMFNGLDYFNYLLEKYTYNINRVQSQFIENTKISQDTYRRLRGYKKGGIIGENALMKAAFGLGISYEEAIILFLGFGRCVICEEPTYKIVNLILLELDNLYDERADSAKRMARMDELIWKYDLKIR